MNSRNRQPDERLDKELRFHLDQHAADLIARGLSPEEALREARLSLGGPDQVKEGCRDARPKRWLGDFVQDVRYAARTFRKQPGFAAVALVTLGLGCGAATVMFSVVNGVLLKPLNAPEPDRLVRLQEKTDWATQWGNLWGFAYPNFLDSAAANQSLALGAYGNGGGTVSDLRGAEYVGGLEVSAGLFPILGVNYVRGRGFLPEDDRAGASPVAVISYDFWQRHYDGAADVVGRRINLNQMRYAIIGVTPPGFRIFDGADIFTPLGQDASPRLQNRGAHGLIVWGRLRPGITMAAASTELAAIGRRLAGQYPATNKGRTFIADPLRPDVGDVSSTLWLLLGAVGAVLLIACANIASLLLARAVARERELAMRVALGAGRGRLVRQCLTESAVLALAGGAFGIVLAAAGLRPFVAFWPGGLPRSWGVEVDWRVLLFALSVSLASGMLFGLAPALRASARDLERTLRAGGRTLAGTSRRLHGAFVVVEIALAVALLVSAGMLGRTLLRLTTLDPGVNLQNVVTARMALSPATLAKPAAIRVAWQEALENARRVPGVEAIATVDTIPMREGNNPVGYWTTPVEPPPNEQPLALANSVSPDYLKVMGMALRRGRFFDDRDRLGAEGVVVIDEVMARHAFGGEDPIGKHLWIGMGSDPVRVVGLVGHVRYWGPAGDDRAKVRAQLYYPFAQVPDNLMRRWSELMSIAVRTSVDPSAVIGQLRRQIRGASGDQVLYEVNTMEQLSQSALARQRFLLLLFGVFAGLALLLACIGVYGVLAYLTNRRVPEFGVRMAMGASAGDVVRLVLRQSFAMIFVGIALGAAVAWQAARLLQTLVEGMQPPSVSTFAAMVAILVAAALLASFIPARRAGRVDPMRALRQD